MDFELFTSVLSEYIIELLEEWKSKSKGFRKTYHIERSGMSYETWRKMLKGKEKGQKWTLEYFIKTADSFSIPPNVFLSEILKRYKEKQR